MTTKKQIALLYAKADTYLSYSEKIKEIDRINKYCDDDLNPINEPHEEY